MLERLLKDPQGEIKSINLHSSIRIMHNMCVHSLLPRAGSFDRVIEQDLLVLHHISTKTPLSLPNLILNHMMYVISQRVTSFVPYGMTLTRIFRYFNVPLDNEEVVTERNHYAKLCFCSAFFSFL